MGGGTEAFPDLGKHCQHSDCQQLDFLPFNCDGCHKVFCLEHRSYKSHECPKSDHNSRKVVVCEICSASIETTGHGAEEEKTLLAQHEKSGSCDPKKKKRQTCPVKRCKEALTFSNSSVCKTCHLKVCLKHRFPSDHTCTKKPPVLATAGGGDGVRRWNDNFLAALTSRSGKDCAKSGPGRSVSSSTGPSVKAC